MKRPRIVLASAVASLLFSCAAGAPPLEGVSERPENSAPGSGSGSGSGSVAEAPPGKDAPPAESAKPRAAVRFTPSAEEASYQTVPASIGSWPAASSVSAGRRIALTGAFREAYRQAALRGIGLKGSLGGDFLHFWTVPVRKNAVPTPTGSGAYVQNWRGTEGRPNSWGLADLVLACVPADGSRAYLVRGGFLDAYGKGAAGGGANGIAGYGSPMTDEFVYSGGIAQRFELGLFIQDGAGAVFFQSESAPSSVGVPDGVGAAPGAGERDAGGKGFDSSMKSAFRSAWAAAVDSGLRASDADGPVVLEKGSRGGVWVQRFASSSWALVQATGEAVSSRPVILYGPFLEALGSLSGSALDFERTGLPLSDPFPALGGVSQLFEKGRFDLLP